MNKEYKTVNGISFDIRTPDKVCGIIASHYHNNERLRLYYGDTETGRCWMDEYNMMGYIGHSTGTIKIPLLINNAQSSGGPGILDHCIIKITKNKRVLYQHPTFHMPELTIDNTMVYSDGGLIATFDNNSQAQRYIAFMKGERDSK